MTGQSDRHPAWRRIRRVLGRVGLVRSVARLADSARARVAAKRPTMSYWDLPPKQALRFAYNVVLGREPDPVGAADLLPKLRSGDLSRAQLVESLRGSEEFHNQVRFTLLGPSLHLSRCDFIQSLPRASRILDLGGTHLHSDIGAFVALGYPYSFEELIIVDLPHEERHELYQVGGRLTHVESPRGPVRYRYHSMADLSVYETDSFDLVYCGQTIEHVTEEEGEHVLAEVARVLRSGGYLAVDTPNARATRLQQEEFIDPDHKVEYTHGELVAKFQRLGFEVLEAKGLNYLGDSLRQGKFDITEVAGNQGVYAQIEDCYLLAYICQVK